MKRIVLCADDFGQAPHISQAIVDLVELKRLTATSCIVNSTYWVEHAKWLIPFKNQVKVGLHLNLTEGEPISRLFKNTYGNEFTGLKSLLFKLVLKNIHKLAIEAEINAQFDQFFEIFGSSPQFVDGHQHIHQFPIIQEIFLKVYNERLLPQKPFVRLSYESPRLTEPAFIKKLLINGLGAYAFKRRLKALEIPYNASFSGIYDFSNAIAYPAYFRLFAAKTAPFGLIMCHPGFYEASDSISTARQAEYNYFISDDFLNDCTDLQIMISP